MNVEEFLRFQMKTFEIVLKEDIEYTGHDYFKDIYYVPNNLTQLNIDDIDLSTSMFGKPLQYPLCISSLTGGLTKLTKINERIAATAAKYNIAQGIGDEIHAFQRGVTPEVLKSYQIVREKNPTGLIFANLGAQFLTNQKTFMKTAQGAIDLIQADGLEIYIEPLLDFLLYDKNVGTKGLLERIKPLCESITIPIIVKTMSTGLSNEDVRALWDLGVGAVNSQGVGGVSFARIETVKTLSLAQKQVDLIKKRPFDFFGTPTVWSLLDLALRPENAEIPLFIGGGIRDGRQAIKALALGADLITIGYPVLIQIIEDFGYPDENNLNKWFDEFIHDMKMTMCLLGAKNIKELREIVRSRAIIFGRTKQWLDQRNLKFPPSITRRVFT